MKLNVPYVTIVQLQNYFILISHFDVVTKISMQKRKALKIYHNKENPSIGVS